MDPIKHLKLKKKIKVSELVDAMGEIGFGARKINEASEIMKKMILDKDCKIFLGIAGAMVPGGMKEIILDLLDFTDVFVTTGANLTHDLIEDLGNVHYKGSEKVDDVELNKKGIDRIYNVFMENSVYEKLEDFFKENYEQLKKCKTIKEFLWKIGELSPGNGILKKCFKNKISIFCPGIADSGIGLMMWGREANKGNFGESEIRVFGDVNEIIDASWLAKKKGIIYIGGGLPKNFIQQSLQFSKGADYGIQITTDIPDGGGSSGAPLKEGISWGKMNPDANYVNIHCDATIALPLILGSVMDKIK
jgi:deoxyhypusine synthase